MNIDSIVTVKHPAIQTKYQRLIPGHVYVFRDGSEYIVQLVDVLKPQDHARMPGIMLLLKVVDKDNVNGHQFHAWADPEGKACHPWSLHSLQIRKHPQKN